MVTGCICVDYSNTINIYTKLDAYCIPKIKLSRCPWCNVNLNENKMSLLLLVVRGYVLYWQPLLTVLHFDKQLLHLGTN